MGDLIQRVAEAALARSLELIEHWLPGGVLRGHEYLCADLGGGRGESFSINVNTGRWSDFANPDVKGGDLVALYAAKHGLRQIDAAKELARMLGVEDQPRGARSAAPVAPDGAKPRAVVDDQGWTLCRPAPLDAPDYKSVLNDRRLGMAVAHWCYRDGAGALLMVVVRWKIITNGVVDKEIRQFSCWRHLSGALAWRQKWIDRPRPLYREDELAKRPQAPVIVVEGEKAADRAQAMWPDHVAVTSPGGAANGAHADWSKLVGRRVVIIPDADETAAEYQGYINSLAASDKPRKIDQSGSSYAKVVAKLLAVIEGATVQIIDTGDGKPGRIAMAKQLHLADLPRGFDVADVSPGTALDLADLLAAAGPRTGVGDERRKGRVPSGEYHQSLIDALVDYLDERNIAPDALDGWRSTKTGQLVAEDIQRIALDFALEYRHHDGIAMTYILETLDAHSRRRRLNRRRELISAITTHKPTPEDEAELVSWIQAVTGASRELDLAVLRHWIWNAKRMALNLRTAHDLMIVVHGKQGSGKTTAVERLCEPLAELGITINAKYLTDDRYAPVLASALVGRWEEMQGSAKADLESLKNTITSPTISYRPMRTTTNVVLPRTCGFIGTSNVPIDSMVQDVTGNRRFVQLDTPIRCDWDVIKSFDPLKVWRAVDHTTTAPIAPFLHLLQAHQAEHLHRDPFSLWLEAETWKGLSIQRGDSEIVMHIEVYQSERGETFEELAARFQFWCRTVGQSPLGAKQFSLRLQQEGFQRKQPRQSDGTRPRVYFKPAPAIETFQSSQPVPVTQGADDEPW